MWFKEYVNETNQGLGKVCHQEWRSYSSRLEMLPERNSNMAQRDLVAKFELVTMGNLIQMKKEIVDAS
jgi:hypothetical protein